MSETRHIKATREDWLNAARDVLVADGMAEVKVAVLGTRLGVSRSSFYWYFRNRDDLLTALLDDWEARNTKALVANCQAPSRNITEAVCNFFRCFVDPALFDQGLDFAVRAWARRDPALRLRLDTADSARLTAIAEMFARHGYSDEDADSRARILYYMQLGYHALEVREPMDLRMSLLDGYLRGFTGQDPDEAALAGFRAFSQAVAK